LGGILRWIGTPLVAAGLAVEFPARALGDAVLAPYRRAITGVITALEPFPAFVLDPLLHLEETNRAGRRLVPHAPAGARVNLLDAFLAPGPAREQIDKRAPYETTDILRRVTSITIADSMGVQMAVSRRSQKPTYKNTRGPGGAINQAGVLDLANCPLQVAVDGQLKEWGFAVNSISPKEIHGIEIYPGAATIPAEYASMRRDASCGLIMIWTRRVK